MPDDLKGKDDMKGEASLKGHLTNGDEDTSASQAYVPPDEKDDKQLTAAIDLLHGVKPSETTSAEGGRGAQDRSGEDRRRQVGRAERRFRAGRAVRCSQAQLMTPNRLRGTSGIP